MFLAFSITDPSKRRENSSQEDFIQGLGAEFWYLDFLSYANGVAVPTGHVRK
jgi:hypothetical protein